MKKVYPYRTKDNGCEILEAVSRADAFAYLFASLGAGVVFCEMSPGDSRYELMTAPDPLEYVAGCLAKYKNYTT